jgi:uncharacterized RmlC-like cupin family protein
MEWGARALGVTQEKIGISKIRKYLVTVNNINKNIANDYHNNNSIIT